MLGQCFALVGSFAFNETLEINGRFLVIAATLPVELAVTTFPLKTRGRRCLGQCFALVGLREKWLKLLIFILPIDYNFLYMSAPSVCRSHAVALSYVRAFVYANQLQFIEYNFIYISAPSVCRSHAVALSYVRAFVYANHLQFIEYTFIFMSAPSVCRSHAVALSYVRAFVYAN